MESPFIVHVSNDKKEEDSKDIKECMRRIESLVKVDFVAGQEAPTVEEEVDVGEEEVRVAVVNEKAEEENIEKESTEKESTENIVNASEFRDQARPVEVAEITSEKHHISLAIVVYTGPLKVTLPTQEIANDAGEALEIEEQSEDRVKPKKKKRNYSEDKKCKRRRKRG
ncbi:hypothetical protein PVK06_024700 [Gossypium arboreum]|uniref:Uncharacterized protein n=1 Tax=Gossypium arboreum TaxID=29729 RepID=A0ABR0PEF1_GOSAR|nr:hypothetical protein PVK06_024700 [Gossypium arboreum]